MTWLNIRKTSLFAEDMDLVPQTLLSRYGSYVTCVTDLNLDNEFFLDAISQDHVLRSIYSSDYLLATGLRLRILSPCICIRDSYDLFVEEGIAHDSCYASPDIELEKRMRYGFYHNYILNEDSQTYYNDKCLYIKRSRFANITKTSIYLSPSTRYDFVVSWHSDFSNYWHWHFEVLPRILVLRKLLDAGRLDLSALNFWVVGECLSQWQLQSLILVLGSCVNIHYSKSGIYSLSLLDIQAPYPATFHKQLIVDLAHELRLSPFTFERQMTKLYIGRGLGKNGRNVVNEDDILRILTDHGYTSVSTTGKLGYIKQQKYFSLASKIVIPHGAASANLLFCCPLSKIVDLYPSSYLHPETAILSCHLNLSYKPLVFAPHDRGNHDYNVDADRLLLAL